MTNHQYSVDNYLGQLPSVLREDAKLSALATAIATSLISHVTDSGCGEIYTGIDQLPEDLLEILAVDFKVDWWDSGYTLTEKQNTFRDSFKVHRHLGTKYAVEAALSAVFPDTKVLEWFEYDGDPYHFKLLIDLTYEDTDQAKYDRVMELVSFYKNVRSVLDEVEYIDLGGTATGYFLTDLFFTEEEETAYAYRY